MKDLSHKKLLHTLFCFAIVDIALFAAAIGQTEGTILGTVGEKKISVREFLQRSEMTVRPNPFKDKNTTLNNLIVEKILALEAGKNSALQSHPRFRARLKGIKEQAMRERLYYDVAFTRAHVDTTALRNAYKLSIREYEVEFYRMQKALAQKVKAALDSSSGNIDEMFQTLTVYAGEQPVHTVAYKDPDDYAIHDALYTKPRQKGEVVGPIELNNGEYLVMRVLNWTAYPLLSGIDQQTRWKEVQEKEHRIKALQMWESYQASVMRGKKMDFNGNTLNTVSSWARGRYIAEQQRLESPGFQMPEILSDVPGVRPTVPFFTFENNVWSFEDFKTLLTSHPLTFRTTHLDSANFKEQFKLAVVDLMRDYCLTREAYTKNLDRSKEVAQTVEMWKDAYIAKDVQKTMVDAALTEGKVAQDDEPGILQYWESYVRGLQTKYSSVIHVNTKVFTSISLTSIDMVAVKPGMPYPAVVPDFPMFIASANLDYAIRRQ